MNLFEFLFGRAKDEGREKERQPETDGMGNTAADSNEKNTERQDRLILDALSSERYLTVRDIYRNYIASAAKAEARSKPTDGLFGLGRDARGDSCHEDFYYELSGYLDRVAAEKPGAGETDAIVDFILGAPSEHRDDRLLFPIMFAAAGLAEKLAGFLDPADAGRLAVDFDRRFPKRERMPAQEKVLRALYDRARMM